MVTSYLPPARSIPPYPAIHADRWGNFVAQNNNAFGEWLKKSRKSAKLTQSELAQQVGMVRMQIYRLEKGEQSTRQSTAVRLATVLGREPREALDALADSALPEESERWRREIPSGFGALTLEGFVGVPEQWRDEVSALVETYLKVKEKGAQG